VNIVAISDTHAPRRWKSCPPAVAAHLRGADLILHAGDVCTAAVLDELAGYAPVHAVLGNNDGPDVAAWGAPETLSLNLGGLRVAMIHDSGAAAGRLRRMRRRFPDADLVVFGHSHIPLDASAGPPGEPVASQGGDAGPRDKSAGGLRIFNPGSPTDRRRQPHGTIGLLTVAEGRLTQARIVPVT
jgi:putative phosphoesterase